MWRSAAEVGRCGEAPSGRLRWGWPSGRAGGERPLRLEIIVYSTDAHTGENEKAQQNMWASRAENAPAACVPGSHAPLVGPTSQTGRRRGRQVKFQAEPLAISTSVPRCRVCWHFFLWKRGAGSFALFPLALGAKATGGRGPRNHLNPHNLLPNGSDFRYIYRFARILAIRVRIFMDF